MDAASSSCRDVLELLDREGAEYAIKVPFHPWLHLKQVAARGDGPGTRKRNVALDVD